MSKTVFLLSILLVLLGGATSFASTDDFNPIVIYQGDIQANSFNLTIHEGVARFVSQTGVNCEERVVGNDDSDFMGYLERVCQSGYNPVFLLYGNHIKQLTTFIRKYPDIRFIALGTVRDAPNMFSLDFAEHEGSFLAGALAAMVSKSRVIAFVSVSDLPLMRRFACGYEQGARYVDPEIKVLTGFIGTYPNAWFDSEATSRMANAFMDQGADIVYQAAGAAGLAVLEAAAKRGRLGVGVDRNQNGLFPGHVLTSMVKRSDQVVFAALVHAYRGVWRDNIKIFGLAQDAVGLVFDENNASLVSPAMRERVEAIKGDIVLGRITVHDYVSDNRCP